MWRSTEPWWRSRRRLRCSPRSHPVSRRPCAARGSIPADRCAAGSMPLARATQLAAFPAAWTRPGAAPAPARAVLYVVTPGYGEAIGLRLKAGRLFRDSDLGSQVRAWVVNEEFARLYLPPQPIGYQWNVAATGNTPARTNEIVGIVANVLKAGNDSAVQPEFYQVPN